MTILLWILIGATAVSLGLGLWVMVDNWLQAKRHINKTRSEIDGFHV